MRSLRSTAAALALVPLLVAGCTSIQTKDLVGSWQDAQGRSLPDGSTADGALVITTYLASASCDGPKDTVYLELAWPVGRPASAEERGDAARTHHYARGDTIEQRVSASGYAPDVVLPATARSTGFAREGNTLSIDPAGYAYVTRSDGQTERWPQIELGCA